MRARAATDLLVLDLGVVPTALRSHTTGTGRAPTRPARASSLGRGTCAHEVDPWAWCRTIVRSFRQASSISTVWLGSRSIHLTREREISHFEALAESRGSREMSPLRQSARVARGLSIEPSNIDSGEPPTSAEPRASPDRENCPLSEPLSSLPASGWSI